MTTDKTRAEPVLVGREVGGNKAKNIQWDAVDANKRVLRFADGSKCGQDAVFELRNLLQGDATEMVSILFDDKFGVFPLNVRWKVSHIPQLFVESIYQLWRGEALSRVSRRVH